MYIDPSSELGIIRAKTGYIFDDPKEHEASTVFYLEVIRPLKWFKCYDEIDSDLIPVGSLTWAYHYDKGGSVHPEDNKLRFNLDPDCFRLVSIGTKEEVNKKEETITYRFKTKEEFIRDGCWIYVESKLRSVDHPRNWEYTGKMNKYLGQVVSPSGHRAIRRAKEGGILDKIFFDGWQFKESDFVGKDVIPPPREISDMPEELVEQLQQINQLDWRDEVYKSSPPSTSHDTASIQHMEQKETINDDDIVIESTINITI